MRWFSDKPKTLQSDFETALGENLCSLIQYGSSVKNKEETAGNINLLIILNRSTPEAHGAIHDIISGNPLIEPFILERRGFERTVQSFAVKFLSIRRHYQVLCGEDLLANINISIEHEQFLAEQALRNLRLRIVNRFAKHGNGKFYLKFVTSLVTSIFIDIAEVLRCEQKLVPTSNRERVAAFAQHFEFDVEVLSRLLNIKLRNESLAAFEIEQLHRNLFILLDNVLLYIETHWHE